MFPEVGRLLDEAIANRVFPGAVLEIGRTDKVLATLTRGSLRYSTSDATTADTMYDLASLTKVIATSAISMQLVLEERFRLENPVAAWIPEWVGNDRRSVTIQDLLEHCSGLPDHRPYFETMRGRAAYQAAIGTEPLAYAPRWQSIYSDPGFILLGFILERAGDASLDAQFTALRDRLFGRVALTFLPRPSDARIAPTEITDVDGEILGRVHDENAAALGGVAGHAGLFGTAAAVGAVARWWLNELRSPPGPPRRTAVVRRFVQKSAVPGSSRALGWDTMLPTSSCGRRLSSAAIGHTGFTGTSLWIDPTLDLYVVILSNRVHPTRRGEGIQPLRRTVHDAVVDALELS